MAMTTVAEVVGAIDRAAPFWLQLETDNSGLLVGDPRARVRRVLVALDPTAGNVCEAARAKAECLVTHHPLFFSTAGQRQALPLRGGITTETTAGAVALEAARAGVALVAAHTNYDLAAGGLNDILAALMGLKEAAPMAPAAMGRGYKLVTFLPEEDLDRVEAALFAAGAGRIGDYSECAFRSEGVGSFRGGARTHPTAGVRGRKEYAEEVRLETVVPAGRVEAVVAALREAHSYEEPAFDLVPLDVPAAGSGLGRVGDLEKAMTVAALVARAKRVFGVKAVEVVGERHGPVRRLAVGSGSAGDWWTHAARAGAEVYLTGEMKHSDRLAARDAGLVVIVAGHFATEQPAVAGLAVILRAGLAGVSVVESRTEKDPSRWR
jgi:dinuclear metal center YbgI/SA1388 family protein